MTGLDVIDLEVGGSSWLQALSWALAMLGFSVLLASPAAPALKALLLVILCLAGIGGVLGQPRRNAITHLRLLADGSAILYTATGAVTATLCDSSWCSRWCSVVPLIETLGGRRVRCLLCRSRNPSDSYRRLLVHLRLAGTGREPRGVPA